MNKNKAAAWLTSLLLLAFSAVGQQKSDSPFKSQSLKTFTAVIGQPEYLPSNFEFSMSDYQYRISNDGRGKRTGKGAAPQMLSLHLDKGESLEHASYYAQYQGDVLMVCEVSEGDGGAGFIIRMDGRTLRVKWKRWIPAFNIGQGLIEGDYAYLTGIGFIGKVSLKSGAYAWRHHNLYRDGDFNSFELPRVEGDKVLFKEKVVYEEPSKTIRVQKQSGKIISVQSTS